MKKLPLVLLVGFILVLALVVSGSSSATAQSGLERIVLRPQMPQQTIDVDPYQEVYVSWGWVNCGASPKHAEKLTDLWVANTEQFYTLDGVPLENVNQYWGEPQIYEGEQVSVEDCFFESPGVALWGARWEWEVFQTYPHEPGLYRLTMNVYTTSYMTDGFDLYPEDGRLDWYQRLHDWGYTDIYLNVLAE
jgi:hypothetical protein